MSFLQDNLALLSGQCAGHMGPYYYMAHTGRRNGKSTSGDMLWKNVDEDRSQSAGNMVNAELNLLQCVARDIDNYIPLGTTVIDLGPGPLAAFQNKTLPIIRSLQSSDCILVDESISFLTQIAKSKLPKGVNIKPIIDDFFNNDAPYAKRALVCSFGSTVGNLVAPMSSKPPKIELANALSTFACAAANGWMLIAFNSDQDGKAIQDYFMKYNLFQLNIFDRMKAELPIRGDFDPSEFDYTPVWGASSGQLAHIATVKRRMKFVLGRTEISLNAGQRLHLKNSFKYRPEFFEECCNAAGLEIIKKWSDGRASNVYLLKITPLRQKSTLKTDAIPLYASGVH